MIKRILPLLMLPVCAALFARSNPGDIWLTSEARYLLTQQEYSLEMYMNTGDTIITAFHLEIVYDPLYLEPDMNVLAPYSSLSEYITFANLTAPGMLSVSVFRVRDFNTGPALPVFAFPCRTLAESGETAISITISDVTDDAYSPVAAAGEIYSRITVADILPGDCNGDRQVDIVDALMVARIGVGLIPQPGDYDRCDVNCDGKTNIVDALMIARYFVGLITEFCSTAAEPVLPALQPATSPGDLWFEPGEMLVRTGQEFTQDIYIDTGTDRLGAYQLDIFYDSTMLNVNTEADFDGITQGRFGFLTAVNTRVPGKISINGIDNSGVRFPDRKFHPFTVHWRSLDVTDTCPVYMTVQGLGDIVFQPLEESKGGAAAIKIVSEIKGDLNDDNKINAADAVIMLEYIPEIIPNPYASDINGDGELNIVDGFLLAYYSVGLPVPDDCNLPQLPDAADLAPLVWLTPAVYHALPGDSRTWGVYLSGKTDTVDFFEIEISFDPGLAGGEAAASPPGVSAGPDTILNAVRELQPGWLNISGSLAGAPAEEALLCTITLQAGSTIGETALDLEVLQLTDAGDQTIGEVKEISSLLKIQNDLYGDANNDGIINAVDALKVSYCYTITPCNDLCDVDLNGEINIIDALLITQYSVGLIPSFN